MTPYYSTPERRAALIEEARSWLGTPFRENCAVKGKQGGVDCTRFVHAVHTACGACENVVLEVLPVEWVRSWHTHHTQSRILDFFGQPEVRTRLRRLDEDESRIAGDMAILKIDQTEHHVALCCGHEFLHVMISAGVVSHSIHDKELMGYVRSYYRIYEKP